MKAAINKSGSHLRLQRDAARFVYDSQLPYLPGNDDELYYSSGGRLDSKFPGVQEIARLFRIAGAE